jgi:hypothetical protein
MLFDQDLNFVLYTRKHFSYPEKLYEHFMNMRSELEEVHKTKYGSDDPYRTSEEYKQGFMAGVKIMSAILMDL